MHEWSIAVGLLRQARECARAAGAGRVRRVRVRVGAVSGVEARLLATAWTEACRGEDCDGAELVVVAVPAAWACSRCSARVEPSGPLRCAACGAPARLESGDDLVLDEIEVERPAPPR